MPPKKRMKNGSSLKSTSKKGEKSRNIITIQDLFSKREAQLTDTPNKLLTDHDQSASDYAYALKLQQLFDSENQATAPEKLPKDVIIPEEEYHTDTFNVVKESNDKPKENLATSGECKASFFSTDSVNKDSTIDYDALQKDPLTYVKSCRARFVSKDTKSFSYSSLANTFSLISSTKSRIRIVTLLTNFLFTLLYADPDSLIATVWLCTNSIAPNFYGKNLGVGPAMYSKALKEVCGITASALKNLWNKYGDPGDVAFEAKVSVRTLSRPEPLTIKKVYSTLLKIADSNGNGAQNRKLDLTKFLLISSNAEEVRYIGRSIMQNLRIGAVQNTMLASLSKAFFIFDNQNEIFNFNSDSLQQQFRQAEEIVKQSFFQVPDYNILVATLLREGIENLKDNMSIRPGIPVKPMLGSITKNLQHMLERLTDHNFSCEFKYDGQRAQIHCDRLGNIKIFSRHLEEITGRFPDVIEVAQLALKHSCDFIIEGELVAIDKSNGQILDFQKLSTRERKKVTVADITIDVCVFVFDIMFCDGKSCLQMPLIERRRMFFEHFNLIPNRFQFVSSLETNEEQSIQEFFSLAITNKCEGLMVKVLNGTNSKFPSTYEPDKRGEGWIKVKQDYDDEFESLDLVPIGAWYGNGRKAGWFSPILLAVYNPDTGAYEAVCKCMSGFSDQFYKELTQKYSLESGNSSLKPIYNFCETGKVTPQIYFAPQEVWEIKGAQITSSPAYKAALGLIQDDRGLSIRFPRFIRVRSDKGPEDASTNSILADMYMKQLNT
ncbi:DNA ligase [Schizosaccharomyces pombe]